MINWGFISTAEIATKVYEAIRISPNAQVHGIASRSLEKAQIWKANHPETNLAFGSYEEILEHPEIQAIYIPLPTAYKTEWAIKAARAKKHVLLEKPLPTDLEALKSIIEACQENGVNFMDGTMWLHSLRTGVIQDRVKVDVGTILRINAAFTFKAESEEWLNGGNGRTDKTREPQGCLECGWYPIGAIMWVMDFQLPTRVQVLKWTDNTVDTLVYCGGVMWFGDGVWATFDCGYTAAHRCYYEVSGSDGTLLVEDLTGGQGKTGNFNAYFENFTGSSYFKLDNEKGKEEIVQVEPSNHTALMVQNFSNYILEEKIESKWGQISLAMQTVLNAVFESYQKGGEAVEL